VKPGLPKDTRIVLPCHLCQEERILLCLVNYSRAITVPFKGALQRCEHNRETMFVQSVETVLLAEAEGVYEIRRDLRKGLTFARNYTNHAE